MDRDEANHGNRKLTKRSRVLILCRQFDPSVIEKVYE